MKTVYLALRTVFISILLLTSFQHRSFAESQVTIQVHFLVFTPDGSAGLNAKWLNTTYVQRMLNRANANLFGLATFTIGSIQQVNSSSLYNSQSQMDALNFAYSRRQMNSITVAISGPFTQDSVGRAYSGYEPSSPAFAMRSRYNQPATAHTAEAIQNNSLVFLHELGHNMKLDHCASGQTSLCTDNIWSSPANAQQMVDYLISVVRYVEPRSGSDR